MARAKQFARMPAIVQGQLRGGPFGEVQLQRCHGRAVGIGLRHRAEQVQLLELPSHRDVVDVRPYLQAALSGRPAVKLDDAVDLKRHPIQNMPSARQQPFSVVAVELRFSDEA